MKLQTIARVALAGTALIGLVSSVGAASGGTPPGASKNMQQASAPLAVGPKKLIATYITAGNGSGAGLPQFAFTPVDIATVNCKNAGGCTIGIETMSQIQPQGGDWAICLAVDGVYTSCQYQGIQGSTSGWVVGNARGLSGPVAFGNHTVRTDLYVEGAGAIYGYLQSDYRVYKP